MNTINIIATTISGSIKDWKKTDKIKSEFEKHYAGKIEVFVVDSHEKAKHKANELAQNSEHLIVSAGGSGTFASILEGCRLADGYAEDLRLAFLRKGSADLLGKVLNMPDDLATAAKIISQSFINDTTIDSDVIEVTINGTNYHFIGYGGVGVFGVVPFFTESKIKKYYKGILGYLFGDRGPFLFGVNLSILKFYFEELFRQTRFNIVTDQLELKNAKLSNVLIMNGDLGKHYPIATGMPLATGNFQVSVLKNKGILTCYKQLMHAWKGNMNEYKEKLGLEVLITKNLTIESVNSKKYMVNVDGALHTTRNLISYRISDKIKLITN
jgi:diacylglycerol kinase family enzyme